MLKLKSSILGLLTLSVLSAFAPDARAAEVNFVLGGRTGITFPLGNVYSSDFGGTEMSRFLGPGFPIQLDFGVLFAEHCVVGGYGAYAPLLTNNCSSGSSCGADTFKVGLQAQYWFLPRDFVNPWVGLGIGYEWLSVRSSYSSGGISYSGSSGAKGLEFVTLQGGADFRLADAFSLGPYAAFALGQYDTVSSQTGSIGSSADIPNKSLHEWFTLGVRVNFVF